VGGSFLVTKMTTPSYSTKISLYVSARIVSPEASAVYDGTQLSLQRISSYAQLLISDQVTTEVIKILKLDTTPEELAKQITTTTSTDTVIIGVTVTDSSPETAARIAATLSDVFTATVAKLEQPADPAIPPPVIVRLISPPAVPTSPVSPNPPLNYALGAVLGLIVGVGAAVLRGRLDRTIKSSDQLRPIVGAPVLGVVPADPTKSDKPMLTVHEDGQSPRSEAFRALRTNIRFVDIDNPPSVFVVTSAVAEEGKSTTVCNLAIAMAESGRRVLVIEGDLRRPRVSDYLGVDRAVGLTTVLTGRVSLSNAAQAWWGGSFSVLASGPIPPNPSELLGSQHMAALLAEARTMFDVVLIDSPPLLPVTDAAALAPLTDGAVLVVRYGSTQIEQVETAVGALHAVSARVLGAVLTGSPQSTSSQGSYRSFDAPASDMEFALPDLPPPAAPRPAGLNGVPNGVGQHGPVPNGVPYVGPNGASGSGQPRRPAPRADGSVEHTSQLSPDRRPSPTNRGVNGLSPTPPRAPRDR
jgi:non-specific protein-tyrosine kinase